MIAAEETTADAQTPTTIALMANVLKGDTGTIAKRTKETGIQGKVDGAVDRAAPSMAAANTGAAVGTGAGSGGDQGVNIAAAKVIDLVRRTIGITRMIVKAGTAA